MQAFHPRWHSENDAYRELKEGWGLEKQRWGRDFAAVLGRTTLTCLAFNGHSSAAATPSARARQRTGGALCRWLRRVFSLEELLDVLGSAPRESLLPALAKPSSPDSHPNSLSPNICVNCSGVDNDRPVATTDRITTTSLGPSLPVALEPARLCVGDSDLWRRPHSLRKLANHAVGSHILSDTVWDDLGTSAIPCIGRFGATGMHGGLRIVNRRFPAPLSQQISPRPLTQRDRQELVHFLRHEYRRRLVGKAAKFHLLPMR